MVVVCLALICVLFNFGFDFYSVNIGTNVVVDLLPDFVGYLILCFTLEKKGSSNRWFREAHSISVGMLIISFLVFLSQIRFLFASLGGSIDSEVFSLFISLITTGAGRIECLIYAFTMGFAAFFSLSMMSEADKISNKVWSVVYIVLFILYIIMAVIYIVLQFVAVPFSPYIIALPVNFIFLMSFYLSTKSIDVFNS